MSNTENKSLEPASTVTEQDVIDVLYTCYDPEIPLNIYDLGLIYGIRIDETGHKVEVDMTLTSPNCPSIESLPMEVEEKIREIPGVEDVQLKLVWEPPFSMDLMSDEARLALGLL
ncbi:MAG: DUF59 domain-containing protein [Leptospiraceae bacterium]|nr:DUF59 domain-containing protein [Leptospiraceae bacterium]MCB1199472.1 DUF59 domain-containing protein [Leptospiraceae bacterium]